MNCRWSFLLGCKSIYFELGSDLMLKLRVLAQNTSTTRLESASIKDSKILLNLDIISGSKNDVQISKKNKVIHSLENVSFLEIS